jgi:uncharacterized C2H2 Zn-finger protein
MKEKSYSTYESLAHTYFSSKGKSKLERMLEVN